MNLENKNININAKEESDKSNDINKKELKKKAKEESKKRKTNEKELIKENKLIAKKNKELEKAVKKEKKLDEIKEQEKLKAIQSVEVVDDELLEIKDVNKDEEFVVAEKLEAEQTNNKKQPKEKKKISKSSRLNKKEIEQEVATLYEHLVELDKKQTDDKQEKEQIYKDRKKTINRIYKLNSILENTNFNKHNPEKIINFYKPIVSLKNVSKFYSSPKMVTRVLNDVSLDINERDFVVILGPSGSGKTTLMNLISGIDKTTFGSVRVLNYYLDSLKTKELTSFRKDVIGYIFQRYGLLPNLNVKENILMGQYLGKKESFWKRRKHHHQIQIDKMEEMNKKLDKKRIDSILGMLNLTAVQNKYPYELSGGQKQRVSIARTLAKRPKIIFGDEPTAAVDEDMSKNIIEVFSKINKELGTTIIMITHDERISYYANKVVYILDGKIDKIIDKCKNELIPNENKKN